MAEVETQVSGGKPAKSIKARLLNPKLLILVVVILFAAPLAVIAYSKSTDKEQTIETASNKKDFSEVVQDSDNSDASKSEAVKQFGQDYQEKINRISNSKPQEWDGSFVEDSTNALLYADKIGDFSQVYTLLFVIDYIKRSGVNVDDNSYGVNQEQRDAIKQRADVSRQKASGGEGSQN